MVENKLKVVSPVHYSPQTSGILKIPEVYWNRLVGQSSFAQKKKPSE